MAAICPKRKGFGPAGQLAFFEVPVSCDGIKATARPRQKLAQPGPDQDEQSTRRSTSIGLDATDRSAASLVSRRPVLTLPGERRLQHTGTKEGKRYLTWQQMLSQLCAMQIKPVVNSLYCIR